METLILIGVLAVIIGLAVAFVVKSKKKGKEHCIGCPCAGTCKGKCQE